MVIETKQREVKYICICCKKLSVVELMTGLLYCEICHWQEYELALEAVHNRRLIAHIKECRYTKRRIKLKTNVHISGSSNSDYADLPS